MPPTDPDIADTAPTDAILTPYDHEHLVTYMRLLDADADGADWREVARMVLPLDPGREPARCIANDSAHRPRREAARGCGFRGIELKEAASVGGLCGGLIRRSDQN